AQYRYRLVYTPPPGRPPPAGAAPPPAAREHPAPRETGVLPEPWQAAAPRSANPALGELIPCGGGDPLPLLKPQVVIGRSASCDMALGFAAIPARHCQLEWTDGQWFVRDLGSRNGIKVDGVRCQAERLTPESVLWIAGLRFQVIYQAQGVAEPPRKGPAFTQS